MSLGDRKTDQHKNGIFYQPQGWSGNTAGGAHYLSYTKISQTKCYKQYDTSFQFSFHCSFRCCAPFCLLCCSLRPLLLIGGKLSTANQDPPKDWFWSATQRAKPSTPSERSMKTELKSDVRLFVAFCLNYFIVWQVVGNKEISDRL